MFLRCILISFFSSFVHLSSVFRIFISIRISPVIERTSIRMACLLIRISLLRYFLIIGSPRTTLFSQRSPFPPNTANMEDPIPDSLHTSLKSSNKFQSRAPVTQQRILLQSLYFLKPNFFIVSNPLRFRKPKGLVVPFSKTVPKNREPQI
jgi:hypothetical protein